MSEDISDEDFAAALFKADEATEVAEEEKEEVEAEAEVEEVEEESETDEAEDEAEEEAPQEEIAAAPVVTDDTLVKVRYEKNGEEVEVSLGELKAGNIRHADYTRRTQELAEIRRDLQDTLTQWAIQKPPEPNWVELAQTLEPGQFQVYKAQYDTQAMQAQQAQQMLQEMHAEQAAEHAEAVRKFNEEQARKLVEKFPDLSDNTQKTVFYGKISKAAQKYGFTEEELQDIPDARYVEALYDLAQYMDKQSQRPAVEKKIAATSQSLSTSAPPPEVSKKAKQKAALKRIRETEGKDDSAFAEYLFSG